MKGGPGLLPGAPLFSPLKPKKVSLDNGRRNESQSMLRDASPSFSVDAPGPEITRCPRQGPVPQSPCASVCRWGFPEGRGCSNPGEAVRPSGQVSAAGLHSLPHRTALALTALRGHTSPSASVPGPLRNCCRADRTPHWEKNTLLKKAASSSPESPRYINLVIYPWVILF